MHAGKSGGSFDGVFGRIMRRLLQLRTSEGQSGDEHQRVSVSAGPKPVKAVPKIRFRDQQIEMAHGAGGKASRRLVEGLFAPFFFPASTGPLADAAHLKINGAQMAVTTDSFVVKPLIFPGGSIGELAVNGTVNDLAVSGAKPEAIVLTLILEAGLRTEILQAEIEAIASAAQIAGVRIAGGDTKVVEHGKADSMYITTTGLGPARRQSIAIRSRRRSRHHHFAGPRRSRNGGRPILRHAQRVSAGGSHGARCGSRRSLDARSHSRRCGHVIER